MVPLTPWTWVWASSVGEEGTRVSMHRTWSGKESNTTEWLNNNKMVNYEPSHKLHENIHLTSFNYVHRSIPNFFPNRNGIYTFKRFGDCSFIWLLCGLGVALIPPKTEKWYLCIQWVKTQGMDTAKRKHPVKQYPRDIYTAEEKNVERKLRYNSILACNMLFDCGQVSFSSQSSSTHRRLGWEFSKVSWRHASLVIGSCSSRPGSMGA